MQSLQLAVLRWRFAFAFGALALVLAASPSTYRPATRAAILSNLHASTAQTLPWFAALASLLSLVLIRIVVVTAASYGLSQLALQVVVRVLVLELIPLSAALFVALRIAPSWALPKVGILHIDDLSLPWVRRELVPRVLAEAFAVVALAVVSSALALVLAYLVVYGFSPWGLPVFTRTIGRVFDPIVSTLLVSKILAFAWAVATVPLAARLERPDTAMSTRLFVVLLGLEAATLSLQYV